MDCDSTRDAISAQMDGRGEAPAAVASHLAECAECTAWRARAHRLAQAQVRSPVPAPRPPAIETMRPAGFKRNRWLRIALAWAGVLLLAWHLPGMITGGDDAGVAHLFRHQSAFSAALGLTFVFVAWRPDRAYGLVPFAAAFTVALAFTAMIDLVKGTSDRGRETWHLVEIAGLAVLWTLGAAAGPGRRHSPPPANAQRLEVAPDPDQ